MLNLNDEQENFRPIGSTNEHVLSRNHIRSGLLY
mgnify:CR=1 FL=1